MLAFGCSQPLCRQMQPELGKPPWGLDPPVPSRVGARDGRVFHSPERLLVQGLVCTHPFPLPRPGATLGFSTPREATADSPWGLLGGHSCYRKVSSPKACRRGALPSGGPRGSAQKRDSGAVGLREEGCPLLRTGSSVTSSRDILTAVDSHTAPALGAHVPWPQSLSPSQVYKCFFARVLVCMAPTCVCKCSCLYR